MHVSKASAIVLALVAAACGQGSSDNVMSPEANALEPAEINAALGPEESNTTDMNAAANNPNGVDNGAADDEPATNNASEQESRP